MVVCGVPGAGKSTLARHLVDRWGAVSFASETFAQSLGAAGRTSSGDLTPQAIAHAYSAMAATVGAAIPTQKLVVAVGSFRAQDQRARFRAIAMNAGASITMLRIYCPTGIAAARVRSRIASGEHGPTENGIKRIDTELGHATDMDVVLTNDTSIEHLHRRADSMIEFLMRRSNADPPAAAALKERFEELAALEFALVRTLIEPKRFSMGTRREAASVVEQELQRSRLRIRELRHCLLLGMSKPIESHIEATLQQATDAWIDTCDRLGAME